MQHASENVEKATIDGVFNEEFNRWVSCKSTNIGSDLSILGNESAHCTMLKFSDPDESFTVLSEVNYCLDELICPVSDTSMYFILDLNKAQDALVGDDMIINIILTSIALNRIKTGHIYLMFKSKEKPIVKLYDLTLICEIDPEDSNCIVTVLGKLLHKCSVGLQSTLNKHYRPKLLQMLLESSIALLKQEVYPEIISWTHVALCELYIPLATIPEAPTFMDDDIDDIDIISSLQSPLNNLSTERRCISALRHIAMSFDALQFLQIKQTEEELEKTPNFQKATKEKKIAKIEFGTSLIAKEVEDKPLTTRTAFDGDNKLWRDQVKMRLYQNCITVYSTLVEYYLKIENYGASLRCLELLFYYNKIGHDMYALTNSVVMRSFYIKAGDIFLAYAKNWSQTKINHNKEYCTFVTEDQDVLGKAEEDVNKLGGKDAVYVKFGNEDMTFQAVLEKGIKYYYKALKHSKHNIIYKKLIEAYNELGLFFLKKIGDEDYARLAPNLCMKAKTNFNQAVSLLNRERDSIEPSLDCAVLYNNIGNLHRILGKNAELEYKTAIVNYHTSLKILDRCSNSEENLIFQEEVLWNLRSTEFTNTSILYEKVNNCKPDLVTEQEVQKVLQQLALSVICCKVPWDHPHFLRYKDILGKLYLYMATMKFLLLKKSDNLEIFKFNLVAIERLYNDAASCFCEIAEFEMFLRTLHEKFIFLQYVNSATENSKHAILYRKAGLHGIFSMRILLQYNLDCITNEMAENLLKFLEDIKLLVQKILQNLLKLLTMAKKTNVLKLYKDCYKKSLYIAPNSNVKDAVNNLFTGLEEIETDLRKAQQIL